MAKRERSPALAINAAVETARRAGFQAASLLVAFSGGLDSTALLLASVASATTHRLPVSAIHFDHGWSGRSPAWAEHCRRVAAQLGVTCTIESFAGGTRGGASLEAIGRELRYAALARQARPGTLVLTAHQADDLAETFFLMALRGSGPHGLAAIAPHRPLGEGLLMRPLLALDRAALAAYVAQSGLPWLEDPSNAEEAFDRNYLRRRVMPAIREHWPAANATLQRAARIQFEASAMLDEAARLTLEALGASTRRLPLPGFLVLSPERQRLCLRYWVAAAAIPLPGASTLERLCTELPRAAVDRIPALSWPGGCVRRYDNALWLDRGASIALDGPYTWVLPEALELPGGRLALREVHGSGLSQRRLAGLALQVGARQGGERLLLPGQRHHKTLKHLWQAARVPPWERATLPLVYLGDELLAVPGLGIAAAFAAAGDEAGWKVEWTARGERLSAPETGDPAYQKS